MAINAYPITDEQGGPLDLATLTLADCERAAQQFADPDADLARLFYDGDHWQAGSGWVGARPPASAPNAGQVMGEIEQGFVSDNVIREMAQRHTAGVAAAEPGWKLVPARALADGEAPAADEQARIDEAEAALTGWWDDGDLLDTLADVATTLVLGGRAVVRLAVPGGDADGSAPTVAQAPTLAAALARVYAERCPSDVAGLVYSPTTRATAGLFLYEVGRERRAEECYLDAANAAPDAPAPTIVRVIAQSGEAVAPVALPLGGRLLIMEVRRDTLITAQVMQGQRALNLSQTQLLRNVNLAGSLERMVLNGQPPGQWVEQETGNAWIEGTSTGTRVFKVGTLPVGPSVTNFIMGAPIVGQSGEVVGMTNPSISYRDPVAIDTFTGTRDNYYAALLGQCQQLHALMSRDATASGESRKQARAEFEASLQQTARALNALGRWLIETTLALGAYLAGQPERYADLRCDFAAALDPGPLTSQEQTEIRNQYKDGMISHETALTALGYDDPDAEIARVDAESGARDAATSALLGPFAAPLTGPPPAPNGVSDALPA